MQVNPLIDKQPQKLKIKYEQKTRLPPQQKKNTEAQLAHSEPISNQKRYSFSKSQMKQQQYRITQGGKNIGHKQKYSTLDTTHLDSMRQSTKTQNLHSKHQNIVSQKFIDRQVTEPTKQIKENSKKLTKETKKESQKKKLRRLSLDEKKQLQRVPLSFSDEVPWSGLNGRLVYKGHTPHNSFFLMNNLPQCNENPKEQATKKISFQSDLQFNSKFESGNLQGALRIHKRQYWLFMREDTNSQGLRQWFFFEVTCNKPIKAVFRIYKFSKKHSLYRKGMKPYIKQLGEEWSQKGQNVAYCRDDELKCYYLTFTFQFKKVRQKILVAGMPPYTYSRLIRFIQSVGMCDGVKLTNIGKTLGGVDLPMIQINEEEKPIEKIQKKAIIIFARTHPAETCSNFTLETIIDKILLSYSLRQKFTFYIIPMVNPDGVIAGNHRTSLTGFDLNRKFTFNFNADDKQMFPEVEAVKNLVFSVAKSKKIQFIFDLHGHSAKKNIFAYGELQQFKSVRYLKSRIIPKLLSEYFNPFKYDHCIFQSYKQKQKTARVYFGKKYNINAITIEQSYGFAEKKLIGIGQWNAFGDVLMDVVQVYLKEFMDKDEEMTEKLKEQIEEDVQNGRSQVVVEKERKEQKNEKGNSGENAENKVQLKKEVESSDSQLESGDEELQNTEQGLQELKTKIIVKPQRNTVSNRKSLALQDTSIELQKLTQPYTTIMHQQKIPIISRIMKMRQKRKSSNELIDILTYKTGRESRKDVSQKIRELNLKLPNLEKYLY